MRIHSRALLLCAAAATAWHAPPAAVADSPSARIERLIGRGYALFQDLEYKGAIQILRPLRLDPDATRSQKLRALELIGISHLILGEKARATEAFEDLLTIDAGYQLQHDDGSPKIGAFFEKVKRDFLPGFAAGLQARMDHSAPRGAVAGRPVEVEVVVLVGIERVVDLVLRWRRSDVLDYADAPMRRQPSVDRPRWRARFTPPASRSGYAVDYYVEARNAAGGAIGRVGGPETPLSLPVAPGEADSPGPWYSRWYVIAGGAAILAVGATALAIGASQGGIDDGSLGRVILSP
ncbi:MAG TPA: hypothetical protein VK698_17885 [Kofleriaceae bacterium]|nr:hypothetical protein [Kofleriaceae bacterium]